MPRRRGTHSAAQKAAAVNNLKKARAARASRNWTPGADSRGLSAITLRLGDRARANARPIRQYTSRAKEFEDSKPKARSQKRQYTKFLKSAEAIALKGTKIKDSLGKGRR